MKRIIPRHVHYASEIVPSGGNALLSQIPPLDWTRMAFDSWATFQSFIGVTKTNITDIIGEIMSFIQWTADQIKTVFGSWANVAATAALGLIDSTKLSVNYGKENQLYNGDFELDFNGDGVPDGWAFVKESLEWPTFGMSGAENYKGRYSVYMTTTAGTSGRFDSLLFPVQGNRKYVVTVCVKGSKTATSPYPVYDIRFYKADGITEISEIVGDANVTTTWVQKSFVTPPSDNLARYAKVTLLNIAFNGTIYWDDAQCYEQKNVADYLADALLPWAKLIQSVLPTGLMGTFGTDYTLTKFASGFFSATTEGRGKFAANFVQEAMLDVDAVTQSRIKNAEVTWDKLSADAKSKVGSYKWFSEAELNFTLPAQTTIETDATASNLKCIRRLSGSTSGEMWSGTYTTIDAGNYWALFRMKVASNASSANLIYINWNCTRTNPNGSGRQLHASDFEQSNVWQTFAIPVEIRQNDDQIEFKGIYFVTGITAVYCDYVALIPMAKISTDLLEAYAVTAAKIAAGTITVDKMHANSIDVDQIVAGAVVSSKIALWRLTSDPTLLAGMLWWRSDLNQIRFYDGSTIQWIPKFPVAFSTSNIVTFTWTTFLTLCTSGLSALTSGGVIAPNAVNALGQITDGLFAGAAGLLKIATDFFSGATGRAKFKDDLALPFAKLEAVPYKLPTSAYNYVTNPSYEYGAWGGSDVQSTDYAKFGTYSAKLVASGSDVDGGWSGYMTIRGLTTLTISVWMKVTIRVSGLFQCWIEYYNSSKVYISMVKIADLGAPTDWTQQTLTDSNLPSGACFARVRNVWRSTPSGTGYVDGWQFNVGDQIPAFQDFTTYAYNWCPEKIETILTTELAWTTDTWTNILELAFVCESTMLLIAEAYCYGSSYSAFGSAIVCGRRHRLTIDDVAISGTLALLSGYVPNGNTIDIPYACHTVLILTKGSHTLRLQMNNFNIANTIAYAYDRRLTILKGFYQGGTT